MTKKRNKNRKRSTRQVCGKREAVKRNQKDTVFRMLFREKKELLKLYNAMSGGNYTNPDELEIVTLENALFMSTKNDLAFLIDMRLQLYEHQSTWNPNMPYRFLNYVVDEYERLLADKNIYGGKLLTLPTPKFVVFYNVREGKSEHVV